MNELTIIESKRLIEKNNQAIEKLNEIVDILNTSESDEERFEVEAIITTIKGKNEFLNEIIEDEKRADEFLHEGYDRARDDETDEDLNEDN